MNLVDRDMAQFRFGPFKVVPREKIITYFRSDERISAQFGLDADRQVCVLVCMRRSINFYL